MFPVTYVRHGGKVHPLPAAGNPQLDVSYSWNGEAYDTAAYMRAFRVSGVIAVRDGKVLLERYGLGRQPDDRWISFSVTKSLTSNAHRRSSP
ncbi:MAG: hypothetical protein R3E84_23760 [Pseudomonadales bacterium]